MFTMKELNPYFNMETMKINDIEYTLTKVEEMSGALAVWVSESYQIYSTPYFENIPVSVHVIECNNKEIGMDFYPVEVDSFERYCKVVQTLATKILSPRM